MVSSLGQKQAPTLAVDEAFHLIAGAAFVLCSDSPWVCFSGEEIGATLAEGTVREASDTHVRLARRRAQGHGDNLSLTIDKLEPPQSR